MRTDQITLQTILQRGYEAYARTHALPDYVRRAGWALLACRTALLGGHVQACPEGHLERIWYNSCRHRMCPPCAWLQIERWLVRQKARLLACDTWSQTLILHPHIHGLVTGGGRHESGHWVAVSHGFLLPMRVVMAVFRGKLRAAIRQGLAQGTLQVPAGQSQHHVENLLHKLGRQKWHVPIRERYPYGQGVLIYLARSLRGGPIASQRLVSCDGQQVVFRYEERAKGPGGQAKQRTMCLPIEPFIGRLLRHVPPGRAVLVRGWGLYAHTHAEALAYCRQQLGQDTVEGPVPEDGQSVSPQGAAADPERCPVWGQRLVCTALMPRAGAPPPAKTAWEQVA